LIKLAVPAFKYQSAFQPVLSLVLSSSSYLVFCSFALIFCFIMIKTTGAFAFLLVAARFAVAQSVYALSFHWA